MLFGYAAANLAAFAVVGHLRGRTDRQGYARLAAARPWMAFVLTMSFLSLVGIPPLAGFIGKLALFVASIDGGHTWLAIVAVANTVASLFYYLRIVGPIYFGKVGGPVAVLAPATAAAASLGVAMVEGFGIAAQSTYGAFEPAGLLP